MGTGIAAFACGVIILYSGLFVPLPVLVGAGFSILVLCVRPRFFPVLSRTWVLCLLAGLIWAALFAQWRLADRLDPALEGEPVTVSGYLCSVPEPGAWSSVRFSLCLTSERPAGIPHRLRLAWYGDHASLAVPSPLTVTVVLKRPHGAVNPGGFRYESWLFRQGFGATGSVRAVEANPEGYCGATCRYHRWRQGLVSFADTALHGMDQKPLALSLLLGYRGQLENEQWDVLAATGTIHLVAISGLHLGMVAGLVGLLLRWLLAHLPGQISSRRQRLWLWWGVTVTALGYALLSGFTVPTRRALAMVAIAGWLVLGGRLSGVWQGWLIGLGLVLLTDPFGPLDQGFWLSFGAVAVLILVFSRSQGRPGPVKGLVVAQLAVFAGLWPMLSTLDQTAAWAGLAANIFAIPWLSLVIMPLLMVAGALMAFLGGTLPEPVLSVLDGALGILWWVLATLAGIELPGGRLPFWTAGAVAVATLMALWLPDRRFAVACMLVAAMILLGDSNTGETAWRSAPRVWVWDVGQGTSVLVEHKGQTLLYDTGPESATGYNAVEDVLVPSLARAGIHTVDILVVSHGDSDHAGGLEPFLAHFQPGRIIAGEPERLPISLREQADSCRDYPALTVGQVAVRFWQAGAALARNDSNDHSCVVILDYGGHQVLLPGDISARVERQLLADIPQLADREGSLVLLAAHHGSKTSSGAGFVKALAPDLVVFTAGYRHRYGHPHPDVVARFESAGSTMFNTATTGALRLTLTNDGIDVLPWRDKAPFWIRPSEEVARTRSE